MKFSSAKVPFQDRHIQVVVVDTNFFNLPQNEKATLVRNFVTFFNNSPTVLIAVDEERQIQFYGRPDLVDVVSAIPLPEFKWEEYELAE